MQGSAIAEPSWPSSPAGELRGPVSRRRSSFPSHFFWFSGLFSKHRSRIDAILEPLQSYLRYRCGELRFVGFGGRLTIQTRKNIENYRRKGLTGDPSGGPLPWGFG